MTEAWPDSFAPQHQVTPAPVTAHAWDWPEATDCQIRLEEISPGTFRNPSAGPPSPSCPDRFDLQHQMWVSVSTVQVFD